MTTETKAITFIKMSELPSDARQWRPGNAYSPSIYKSEARAAGICKKLLNNPRSGWTVGNSFKGFLVVTEDRFPAGHEYWGRVTIWFY